MVKNIRGQHSDWFKISRGNELISCFLRFSQLQTSIIEDTRLLKVTCVMRDSEVKPKRNPYCSRCRNHGKSAQVKGHKRHCEYRYCQCEGCKLVECRQIVSAAQIKRRRDQKQDEECGRRIEISPPVLTRAPENDPAALIAKTLMTTKHGASSKQLDVSAGVPSVVGQAQMQNQLPTPHLQTPLPSHMIGLPAFHPAAATNLGNAQHLFRFTAAFSHPHANPSNLLIASGSGDGSSSVPPPSSTLLNNPSFPGMREQFSMIRDIHQTFGPLAIYAWLRSENFNVAKIRALIDMAKVSYDELLQLNGHSPLDLTSPIVDI
jgi:hypothetical protein